MVVVVVVAAALKRNDNPRARAASLLPHSTVGEANLLVTSRPPVDNSCLHMSLVAVEVVCSSVSFSPEGFGRVT